MFRIDLHTHSLGSPDGAITTNQYRKVLLSGRLDYIAITDHDDTNFAKSVKKALGAELSDRIIVGQEITTKAGELIGLFLTQTVPAGLTLRETAKAIHQQGGLVYVPHPAPLPEIAIKLFWHAKYHRDPANRWLRKLLFEKFSDRPESGTESSS